VSACAALLGPRREASVSVGDGECEVTDLAKSALADTTKENEMEEVYFSIEVYGLENTNCLSFGDGKVGGRRHTSGRQQTPPMCLRDYKIALGDDK